MRVLKVFAWNALKLISFVVPIWLGWEAAKEEQAWFIAQPYSPDRNDTPAGIFLGGAFIFWLVVLFVVNLILLGVWWCRKRTKALRLANGGA